MYPQRAKKVLDETLQELGLTKRFEEWKAYQVWELAVGEKIAAHAHPTKIQNGKLSVLVDNTTWVQQLNFFKMRIMDEINKQAGKDIVREIAFKIGKLRRKEEPKELATPGEPRPLGRGVELKRIKLSDQRLRQVEESLRHIKDSEIKDVMRRFLTMEAKFIQAKQEARDGRTKV